MPIAVWLASHPAHTFERFQKGQSNKRRRVEFSPIAARHSWFQDRLRRFSVPLKAQIEFGTEPVLHQVRGLALIETVKKVDSVLVPLDSEEQLLMEYLGWVDCVTMLRIRHAAEITEQIEFTAVGKSRFSPLPASLEGRLQDATVQGVAGAARSVREVLSSWECSADPLPYVLMVLEAIALLTCRGAWHVLPWSSVWKGTELARLGLGLSANLYRSNQLVEVSAADSDVAPQILVSSFHSAADFILDLLTKAKQSMSGVDAYELDASATLHVAALRAAAEGLQVPSAQSTNTFSAVELVNTLFLVSFARNADYLIA